MGLINLPVRIYHMTVDEQAPRQKDACGHYAYPRRRLLWGQGTLLQFAQDYEELCDGVGTVPVGIVELITGELKLIRIQMLEIIREEKKED